MPQPPKDSRSWPGDATWDKRLPLDSIVSAGEEEQCVPIDKMQHKKYCRKKIISIT